MEISKNCCNRSFSPARYKYPKSASNEVAFLYSARLECFAVWEFFALRARSAISCSSSVKISCNLSNTKLWCVALQNFELSLCIRPAEYECSSTTFSRTNAVWIASPKNAKTSGFISLIFFLSKIFSQFISIFKNSFFLTKPSKFCILFTRIFSLSKGKYCVNQTKPF